MGAACGSFGFLVLRGASLKHTESVAKLQTQSIIPRYMAGQRSAAPGILCRFAVGNYTTGDSGKKNDRSGDRRYASAADAIKRIAGTLDQVGDEVLMRLATVNEISAWGGSASLPYAKAFFQPLVEQADAILHRARQRLN